MKCVIFVIIALLWAAQVECVIPRIISGTLTDATVPAQDSWTGYKMRVVHRFGGFCNETWFNWLFGEMLTNWNAGRITHYTLDPMVYSDCTSNYVTPTDPNQYLINGGWDASFVAFNTRLKTFLSGNDTILGTSDDRRLYIRLAHELNGNWYAWSANSTSYKLMWVYTYNKIMSQGFNHSHIQWIFEPVSPYAPDNTVHDFRNYWPGDQYVDWLSLDAYNWAGTTWYEPGEIYDFSMYQLRDWRPALPLMVSETGCSTYQITNGTARKDQWIQNLWAYLSSQNVAMIVYFNTNDGTADWPVFWPTTNRGVLNITGSDGVAYSVYPGYKTALQNYGYTLATSTNPRIMTDAEFFGQLPGYQSQPALPPNQYIYSNGLAYYDWKPTPAPYPINMTDSTQKLPGASYSMSFNLTPWGNAQLYHTHFGFDSSHYNSLVLYAYASTANTKLSLLPFFKNGSNILNYGWTITTANVWTSFTFNLSKIGLPTGILVQGFYIQGASNSQQGVLYLDQIHLLPNLPNWPTSWPNSTTTGSASSSSGSSSSKVAVPAGSETSENAPASSAPRVSVAILYMLFAMLCIFM